MTPLNDDETQWICHQCTSEAYLAATIKAAGGPRECSFCQQHLPCISISELAARLHTVFQNHFFRTVENERGSRPGQPIVEAIVGIASVRELIAEAIQEELEHSHGDFEAAFYQEEAEYCGGSHYQEKRVEVESWHVEWQRFERLITTETRFFNQEAAAILTRVFANIDQEASFDGSPAVVTIGPGQPIAALFRARAFEDKSEVMNALSEPDRELAAPPAEKATAGRMNAAGIAAFYGATTAKVALAEIRPPVGSDAVVARFDVIRPLRLLDLTVLETGQPQGSYFHPEFLARSQRAMFWRTLSKRLVAPVLPSAQAMKYLPTQAIGDFLASGAPRLDGLIYRSPQSGCKTGRNLVLFHHAALTEPLPAIRVEHGGDGYFGEDGWETDYWISVRTAEPAPAGASGHGSAWAHNFILPTGAEDLRVPALRVDPFSLVVHHVDSTEVHTAAHPVQRIDGSLRPGVRKLLREPATHKAT